MLSDYLSYKIRASDSRMAYFELHLLSHWPGNTTGEKAIKTWLKGQTSCSFLPKGAHILNNVAKMRAAFRKWESGPGVSNVFGWVQDIDLQMIASLNGGWASIGNNLVYTWWVMNPKYVGKWKIFPESSLLLLKNAKTRRPRPHFFLKLPRGFWFSSRNFWELQL